MTVSALVVTVSEDEALRARCLEALCEQPGLTLGDPTGPRFPVVVDSHDLRGGRAVFESLAELDGVQSVELVQVYFEEDEAK